MKTLSCLFVLAVVVNAQVQQGGTKAAKPFSITFAQLEKLIPTIPAIGRQIMQDGGGIIKYVPKKHQNQIPGLNKFPSLMQPKLFVAALKKIIPPGMQNTNLAKWIPLKHQPMIQKALDKMNRRNSQNGVKSPSGGSQTQSGGSQTQSSWSMPPSGWSQMIPPNLNQPQSSGSQPLSSGNQPQSSGNQPQSGGFMGPSGGINIIP